MLPNHRCGFLPSRSKKCKMPRMLPNTGKQNRTNPTSPQTKPYGNQSYHCRFGDVAALVRRIGHIESPAASAHRSRRLDAFLPLALDVPALAFRLLGEHQYLSI